MRFAIAVVATVALTGCLSTPDSARPDGTRAEDPQTKDGRFLVEVHCAECHAITRTDRSRHQDAPPLRTLSRNYPVSALEEPLAEGIMVGHPDMPEMRFRPEDVAAIISYLESIQD